MPVVAAPGVRAAFDTSYAELTWLLLLGPGLVAMVLEPLAFLAADRLPRRWFVVCGLAGLAVGSWIAALAPAPSWLIVAEAISGTSSGIAVGLAQASLVDTYVHGRDRAMLRWGLMGLVGDLAAPALIAALAVVGLGWRAGFAIVGAMVAAWAVLVAVRGGDLPSGAARAGDGDDGDDRAAGDDGDADGRGLWAALRLALTDRHLLAWLFGLTLCDLLDEILVVFASLHLRDELGAGAVTRSAVLAGFGAGGAIGLVVVDRLLRRVAALRLLLASSVACTVAYAAWLAAPTAWASLLLMIAVGATAAPLYPLASAQAYAALPGRSGTVQAAAHLFTPLGLALPWLLGVLADAAGTTAALIALAAQPVGLAVIAAAQRRSGRPDASSR